MSFFLPSNDCETIYINIRDRNKLAKHKEFVEKLWSSYKPHADKSFRSDARRHFQERFWEMYLGNTFLDKGVKLNRGLDKGPEFYLALNNGTCWIEAIAPSQGEGPDAVPETKNGIATRTPSDEITLRLRHAIHEKYKLYLHFLEKGIIKKNEPYVLAINSKRITPVVCDDLPLIVKAVYPFGDPVLKFDKDMNIIDSYHQHRNNIEKKSGANISTDIFMNAKHSGISAVIYSAVDAVNRPNKFGSDFRLVHNKMADNPIPIGTFKFGVEYWMEDNKLINKKWG